MEINPLTNLGPVGRTASARTAPARAAADRAESSDASDFSSTAGLENALQNTPDIRPAAVVRGQNLISDANYPPPETIRKIADLLAINWDNTQG